MFQSENYCFHRDLSFAVGSLSRCAYCKLRRDFGFFSFVNRFSEGGDNHNVTCSPSSAENDSRLLKDSEGYRKGVWMLCPRKEADVALFLQVTRIRKREEKSAKQT